VLSKGWNELSEGLIVSQVLKDSIAAEMDIEPGDIILRINNQKVTDVLDLQYFLADDEFTLVVEKKNKEVWQLEITKEPGEFLGIEVNSISVKGLQKCTNNCIFCFVRQMPKGMRTSLYDRDDDYRLSVTQGSYITLSNLEEADFRRIIDLHLSPLYISVHAWNPEVRARLMRNPKSGDLPQQIARLAKAGLTLHTQIVLVPGYNDGEILKETVSNLSQFYPAVQSIGVVPVGLTKFRHKLPQIRTVSADEAQAILKVGTDWQQEFKLKTGKNLVYFSDEFYILAGRDFPEAQEYDGFPQLENGIGMAAKFAAELKRYFPYLPLDIPVRRIHLVTGVSALAFFQSWAQVLNTIHGLEVVVHGIINNFFGPTVTVAGLLTAEDIADQLGDLQGEYFLIPKVMLKADENIFLDDHDLAWLEQSVNGQAILVENNGKAFLEGILGRKMEVLTGE
jgi:putative radical SAM enzyme (TIGR03279 family)